MLDKIISSAKRIKASDWLMIIIPGMVFILHAFLFRSWINDDAGISYAYARNLAQGYGLVSQPGTVPVEGYSNFLWVLLLAPFFSLGIFHPIILPKLLSILIVIVSFVILHKALSLLSANSKLVTFSILILTAINTSFVVWSASGLEIPLYVLLLCLLLFWSVRGIISEKITRPSLIIMGLLVGAAGLTRPEGVIFLIVYPLLLLMKWLDKQKRFYKSDIIDLLIYGLSFAFLFGGYILFRLAYFKDILPNTYYVKGGRLLGNLIAIITIRPNMLVKAADIMASVGGRFGGKAIFVGLVITTIYLIIIKRFRQKHLILLAFLSLTFLKYLLLPYYAIGEFRYNAPLFVFLYSYMVIIAKLLLDSLNLKRSTKKFLAVSMMFIFIGGSISLFTGRSIKFRERLPVPFDSVSKRFGERFNLYADRLGIREGSVLLPDLGGTLYYSRLRVYDLAGLCDRTIARTLRKNGDTAAFHQYIFERAKPTFIHTHSVWSHIADLDKDPRFRRDYIPIYEHLDDWVKTSCDRIIYSGDYVRKDAARDKEKVLQDIRIEFKNDFKVEMP